MSPLRYSYHMFLHIITVLQNHTEVTITLIVLCSLVARLSGIASSSETEDHRFESHSVLSFLDLNELQFCYILVTFLYCNYLLYNELNVKNILKIFAF
jgi:hypothetical protein